jgi:hypothetical protein
MLEKLQRFDKEGENIFYSYCKAKLSYFVWIVVRNKLCGYSPFQLENSHATFSENHSESSGSQGLIFDAALCGFS